MSDLDAKAKLYGRIHEALAPCGVFVNGDATMPDDTSRMAADYAIWAEHMVSRGIPEERAYGHFDEWSDEDTYFPMERELEAMTRAGIRRQMRLEPHPDLRAGRPQTIRRLNRSHERRACHPEDFSMKKSWLVFLATIHMTAVLVLGTGGIGAPARIESTTLTGVAISALKAAVPVAARSREKPIPLGAHRQLFVDDFLIYKSEGVERRLNQPMKYEGNPVLSRVPKGEGAWEAGMPIAFSSVLYDPADGLFKLWYSLHAGSGGDEHAVLCFAKSSDGIRWDKPRLGKFKYRGTTENNIVVPHGGLASGVFLDLHEADPSRRFKMLHMRDDYKIYASHSADGLDWIPYNDGKAVFFEPPGHDSQMIAYWDEALGLYVGIIRDRTGRISQVRPRLVSDPEARAGWRRHWDPRRNRAPENHSIRRVGQILSRDFVHWYDYRVIVGPDAEDPLNRDQCYNMEVMTYEGLASASSRSSATTPTTAGARCS